MQSSFGGESGDYIKFKKLSLFCLLIYLIILPIFLDLNENVRKIMNHEAVTEMALLKYYFQNNDSQKNPTQSVTSETDLKGNLILREI